MYLNKIFVEKPWGRKGIGLEYGAPANTCIGEIWYQHPTETLSLMIKYLFTSAALSVQVHPDDATAQSMGHAHGKDECWYILDAEPNAKLAIGTNQPMSPDALRAAALDGTIEAHLQWHDAVPGHVYEIPSGTIHAIGAGITLIEVQQNIDLTYRLYDYNSIRELHIDAAVAVSNTAPYAPELHYPLPDNHIVHRPHYSFAVQTGLPSVLPGTGPYYVVPIAGRITAGQNDAGPGTCLLLDNISSLQLCADARYILARAG